ncbi:hypothetical protein KIW84_042982 [Lathyrus oleraceus]|uniref:Uncharacterized protein n=1 Tax=Pisum sativum TaxID=3888 RepID=A0A9D4XG18_PEA|nr:hypothetical protein KIW84_042982 [Pisum sativum]
MVDTYSTTIAPTPITFADVPIENQGMYLNVNNVLNPNDIVNIGAKEDVIENEVDQEVKSVEQPVASNKLRRSTRDKRYTNSDLAGSLDDRKSTSGYMMTFSRGVMAWKSKFQKCVTFSTTKAEFIAVVEASKELL